MIRFSGESYKEMDESFCQWARETCDMGNPILSMYLIHPEDRTCAEMVIVPSKLEEMVARFAPAPYRWFLLPTLPEARYALIASQMGLTVGEVLALLSMLLENTEYELRSLTLRGFHIPMHLSISTLREAEIWLMVHLHHKHRSLSWS